MLVCLKYFAIGTLSLFLLGGCASAPTDPSDPWEGVNRATFAFNDRLDSWVAKPLAKGYKAASPRFVEVGVSNFFDNIDGVSSTLNHLLQGKWSGAGRDGSRFLLNSTVGLVGLIDVATGMGVEKKQREDFGQTLRAWGVPKGPYLVLPLLGPSTITDSAGLVGDYYTAPTTYIEHDRTSLSITAVDLLQTRAGLLGADDLVSGDRYLFFREAYLQNREFLVKDGAVEDDFGGELDDFENFDGL